ncbi:MAG TPA: NAD(+)/NADH kinase [Acidimicrobiia bacterium]|nr:NAD(+)/NADH kinase [Acidimicrobiia bacterium]
MNLGLVVHALRPEPREFANRFAEAATAQGFVIVGDDAASRVVQRSLEKGKPPDVMVAIGGDGTVLAASRQALALDIPVLAFNLGTIGFLAEAEPTDLEPVLKALASNEMAERSRMTIAATLPGGRTETGINDIVVEKIHSQRLVSLAATIDGDQFLTYRADGLVVATSTGSTAYSFSAGGPLVDPVIDAILLTPVAAHSLFGRTLVLNAQSVIEIKVVADRPVRVSIDGLESSVLEEGDMVEIRQGVKPARFLTLDRGSFAATVKRKFRLS